MELFPSRFVCLAALLLLAAVMPLHGGGVVLVKATVSVPNESERKYAESIIRNMARWLDELQVPYEVIDDDRVVSGGLSGAGVALLPYNPYPPVRELSALSSFVRGGGRLIVFYAADERMASLMGVVLGKYMTDTGGRWSAMRFTESAPANMPEAVRQASRNIRPVQPASDAAKVIAWWETSAGRLTREPAWVQSSAGLWMTHILLDDGDTWARKQMLVALIGQYEPSVWKPAAMRSAELAATLGRCRSFAETQERIATLAAGAAEERRVRATLAQAGMVHGDLQRLLSEGKYPAAFVRSQLLRRLLVDAYGTVQRGRADEFRGVWNRFGTGLYPGDWDRTCQVLKENRFSDVFPFVASPVTSLYGSRLVPHAQAYDDYGDQLEDCIKAAHRHGLKVHAWKICWKVEGGDANLVASLRKQGRLQVTDEGKSIPWLCPSNPENFKAEKDQVREIVKNYEVDGIHLDYIRYTDGHACFCAGCHAAFDRDTGRKTEGWPAAVKSGELQKEWRRWRCGQITRLVRDVGALARELKPKIKVSAAVYGWYPGCMESVAQDWAGWVRSGYVDFICPMDYTASTAQFTDYVKDQVMLPGTTGKIMPGIGVTATESRLDAVQTIEQINVVRREGASGFVLFELNRVLENEILPVMNLGLTKE